MTVIDFRADNRITREQRSALREFASELGQDIAGLAQRLGLKVYQKRLPSDLSGYLEFAPDLGSSSGFVIFVNSAKPMERQRFTTAHEIAHFVLHKDEPEFRERFLNSAKVFDLTAANRASDEWLEVNDPYMRAEREADVFAVNLLMPGHLVRESRAFRLNRPELLAHQLGLSKAAVANRFKELSRYRRGRKDLEVLEMTGFQCFEQLEG